MKNLTNLKSSCEHRVTIAQVTMPISGAAAAIFALIVARPIIHLRGDYLLIVTIGIVEIVRIALINDVFGLTGGANGIFGISRPMFFGFKIVKSLQFYFLVWGMVGVSLLLFYGLWHSRFGRALNFIKEDDVAAEGCGVNVTHYKLAAFVLGAFWAGMPLAASLRFYRNRPIQQRSWAEKITTWPSGILASCSFKGAFRSSRRIKPSFSKVESVSSLWTIIPRR